MGVSGEWRMVGLDVGRHWRGCTVYELQRRCGRALVTVWASSDDGVGEQGE
jgi:hypothetical protein